MRSVTPDHSKSEISSSPLGEDCVFAIDRWSGLLGEVAQRVLAEAQLSGSEFAALMTAIRVEQKHSTQFDPRNLSSLIVQPGQLTIQKWIIDPYILAPAISTARILSVVLERSPLFATYTEELMTAALLQDFGFMVSPQSREMTIRQIRETMPSLHGDHPAISAALANGIQSCPTLVSCLIRGHHWRCELNRRFEHRGQQFLAIAVAFRECLEQSNQLAKSPAKAFAQACHQIALMAEHQEFEAQICEQFLETLPTVDSDELAIELEREVVVSQHDDGVENLDSAALQQDRKTLRIDSSHEASRSPKYSSKPKPRLRSAIAIRPAGRTRKRIG